MKAMKAVAQMAEQLWMDFTKAFHPPWRGSLAEEALDHAVAEPASSEDAACGRDDALEAECRRLLATLGMTNVLDLVQVLWNPRLRSTAGYAAYPSWRIELNPLLRNFDGQVERTLRHELAHLVAYHRKGHSRIKPHGREWRRACADLGIPDESAHHQLALPRNPRHRPLIYQCGACGAIVRRTRKFRRQTACLPCCRQHAKGRYDERFKLLLVRSEKKPAARDP